MSRKLLRPTLLVDGARLRSFDSSGRGPAAPNPTYDRDLRDGGSQCENPIAIRTVKAKPKPPHQHLTIPPSKPSYAETATKQAVDHLLAGIGSHCPLCGSGRGGYNSGHYFPGADTCHIGCSRGRSISDLNTTDLSIMERFLAEDGPWSPLGLVEHPHEMEPGFWRAYSAGKRKCHSMP